MLNYNFVNQKAKESLIDKITIEREYRQLLILQRLYTYLESEKFFFKGGTALRFLLGSFRFSEDLEFTCTLGSRSAGKLLKEVFSYFQKKTLSPLEFREEKVLEKFQDVSQRYKFLFQPRKIKQKVSIRIDLSFREKPLTKETSALTPFDYPVAPYPLVVHLSPQELLSEKIRALLVRGKGRDLFDLWFLLSKKIEINEGLIKKKFKIYPQLEFSRDKLQEKIKKFEPNELKKDLNQFLPENYRNFYQSLPKETLRLLESR